MPLNGMGGTFAVVSVPGWISQPAIENNQFTGRAGAYTGATAVDYKREGVITLSYTRSGKTIYLYTNVCQYGRDMAYFNTPTLNWSWYGQCNGSSVFIAWGRYVPGQISQTAYLKNVPTYTKITVSTLSSNNFGAASVNENTMGISLAPSSWTMGTPDDTVTFTGVYLVTIATIPYVQSLTLSGAAVVTSAHDIP